MSEYRSYLTIPEMIDQCVVDVKNRGFNTTSAIEQVAEFFGVTPRSVKEYVYYGKETGNRDAIYQRYLAHLTHEEQAVTRKLASIRARIKQAQQ